MANIILLIALIGGFPNIGLEYGLDKYVDNGIATVFSSNDYYNPDNRTACHPYKKLDDGALVIAHRTLPCNTKVVICNKRTNLCTTARVVDRGPYGITYDGKTYQHTSIVDITHAVQRKIRHNGFEDVTLFAPTKIDKRLIRVKGLKIRKTC